jgi:hypothetical protein
MNPLTHCWPNRTYLSGGSAPRKLMRWSTQLGCQQQPAANAFIAHQLHQAPIHRMKSRAHAFRLSSTSLGFPTSLRLALQ